MTVQQLMDALHALTPMREKTVDQILHGDPDHEIKRVATCWMPYLDTLERAYAAGCDTVVCHEPLFYSHRGWDNGEYCDVKDACQQRGLSHALALYQAAVDEKRAFLTEKGMHVIRCHDALDAVPGFGVPAALGRVLGLDGMELVDETTYMKVYQLPKPRLAKDIARDFAARLAPLNQAELCFYGDPEREISAVGFGTGCCCDPLDLLNMGAELVVAIHDIARTWIHAPFARDTGLPLLLIDHGASEEPGVNELTEHLKTTLGLDAIHLPQGAGHLSVKAE